MKQARRLLSWAWLWALCCLVGPSAVQAQSGVATADFAPYEAAGLRIGRIHVSALDVFDTRDPLEDRWLFRLANRLHLQTRPEVVRRALLFSEGEPVSVRLIQETERLLRSQRFLYDVQIRPGEVRDGEVDIEVVTRDTWSLDVGASAGRSGGANTGGFRLNDYNVLGTGTTLGVGRSRSVDRTSTEFEFSNERAFGGWTSIALRHASNSDGRLQQLIVAQPFYSLASRWAAGLDVVRDDRVDSAYDGGEVVGRYRHRLDQAELYGGWSDGLQEGWVRRLSLGLALRDDAYRLEPDEPAPARLPGDQRLLSPFLRYQLLEDRFEAELNRNLIGRPEFFALGLASIVQLGWSTTALGSSRDALLYDLSVARGYDLHSGATLMTAARLNGQYAGGLFERQKLEAQAQYYRPQDHHRLLYFGASLATATRPDPADALMLGGDNGLRGYPLRYQSGTRRVLLTLEQRYFTDIYLWRLFRIGGVAFADLGRAWGRGYANGDHDRWLGDAGVGLRIVSARSAFGNVLHVDLAFPLNAGSDIRKVQLFVKSKTSF